MFYQVVELMFLLLSASVKCSGCFCVGGDLVAMSSALMLLLSSDEWCSGCSAVTLGSCLRLRLLVLWKMFLCCCW